MESNNNYVTVVKIHWYRVALHTLSHLVVYSMLRIVNDIY